MTAAELCTLSRGELARVMAEGRHVAPEALRGRVYRGISLGLPGWVERLSWKKFAKAFDTAGGGFNLRIEQDGLDRPWHPKQRRGAPIAFGRFAVVPATRGVMLDYSVGRGALRALRDPVVALDDTGTLLLGRSLLAVGDRMVGTPSYFSLERDATLDHLAG